MDLNIRIAVINTKNGLRIAGLTDNRQGYTLQTGVENTKKMNKIIREFSKKLNIPEYNYYLDHN